MYYVIKFCKYSKIEMIAYKQIIDIQEANVQFQTYMQYRYTCI
jgi:hypothetical protein